MKLLLIFLCLSLTCDFSLCSFSRNVRSIYKYEFGQNIGEVTFSDTGSIGVLEKVKEVPITVPVCSKLTYVYVEINNVVEAPQQVHFDENISVVTISYGLLQYSASDYTVIAKTVPWLSDCPTNQ